MMCAYSKQEGAHSKQVWCTRLYVRTACSRYSMQEGAHSMQEGAHGMKEGATGMQPSAATLFYTVDIMCAHGMQPSAATLLGSLATLYYIL